MPPGGNGGAENWELRSGPPMSASTNLTWLLACQDLFITYKNHSEQEIETS